MSESEVVSLSLAEQLAALNASLNEARSEMLRVREDIGRINTEIREDRDEVARANYELQKQIQRNNEELQERVNKRQEELSPLATAEWDLRALIRKAQLEADSLQRQIDQQRRAELAAAEWATLEKRWDQLTMGAPWREWAKDHQIEGAKKITYEGRMVLGDTMGLGKTLTALIALDMIQAATKDAAPDNPVEFGSMK